MAIKTLVSGVYIRYLLIPQSSSHMQLMHPIVTRSRWLADAGCASATCVTLTGHNDHDWQSGKDFHKAVLFSHFWADINAP